MKRSTSFLVGAAMTVAAVVAIAVLAFGSVFATSKNAHWATAAELRGSADGDAVPTLVGADAHDIEFRTLLTGRGTQISWASKAGVQRSDCRKGPLSGATEVGASWWPTSMPSTGWTCGWWSVFEQHGRYYAWDHREKVKS